MKQFEFDSAMRAFRERFAVIVGGMELNGSLLDRANVFTKQPGQKRVVVGETKGVIVFASTTFEHDGNSHVSVGYSGAKDATTGK